jgi:hypothetical protein
VDETAKKQGLRFKRNVAKVERATDSGRPKILFIYEKVFFFLGPNNCVRQIAEIVEN